MCVMALSGRYTPQDQAKTVVKPVTALLSLTKRLVVKVGRAPPAGTGHVVHIFRHGQAAELASECQL